MNKHLSVITNFGCHYSCPYCVVKNNNLQIPVTTIQGLDNLHDAIIKNGCNWVSVSGGGDPLHKYENNIDWYIKFFECIPKGVNTELHTSYICYGGEVYAPYDRVVYHLREPYDIDLIRRYNGQIVRVVFVVTEQYTEGLIDYIAEKVKDNPCIDELSFRQMVDNDYKTTHYCEEYLKASHKKQWYYIEQGDYNIYYAENKTTNRYEDFIANGGKTDEELCVAFKNKADFVEVVRCKDCKHFGRDMGYGKHDCKKYEMPYCLENDYCSYGERRTDDGLLGLESGQPKRRYIHRLY